MLANKVAILRAFVLLYPFPNINNTAPIVRDKLFLNIKKKTSFKTSLTNLTEIKRHKKLKTEFFSNL